MGNRGSIYNQENMCTHLYGFFEIRQMITNQSVFTHSEDRTLMQGTKNKLVPSYGKLISATQKGQF